jgi:hypothetical protein
MSKSGLAFSMPRKVHLSMTRKGHFAARLALAALFAGLIVWLEATHPFPKFRFASFVAAFGLLADLASLTTGRTRDALVVVASLAAGCSIAEIAAGAAPAHSALTIDRGWSVRQPVIGWGPNHAGTFHAEMRNPTDNSIIYATDYTFDSNLLRRTVSAESGPTIVFFGDSFTFGDGVKDDETLPQAFADLLDRKARVLNLALTGYGPQQFLRVMETGRFDPVIGADPKLFVFLTAPWHAERTSCKAYWTAHAPLYAVENGRVVYKGECNEGVSLILREWLQNVEAYRKLTEPNRHRVNRADIELYVRVIEAAVAIAKEKYGVPTLIPYLRVPKEYLQASSLTDDWIMDRLRAAGAIVIDASLEKEAAAGAQISIKGDGHPTAYANRLRAELIKTAIEGNQSNVVLLDAK